MKPFTKTTAAVLAISATLTSAIIAMGETKTPEVNLLPSSSIENKKADELEQGVASKQAELWDHLVSASELVDVRGLSAQFDDSGGRRILKLKVPRLNLALGETVRDPRRGIAWVAIPPSSEGWNLKQVRDIQANVKNTGSKPAETTLWVVSSHGWAAVGGSAKLEPNQAATLSCDLRETYPDGTPKIDPGRIKEIRIMIQRIDSASVEVSGLVATGTADEWVRPAGRIDVPDMVEGKPAPSRRVRYQLCSDADNGIYCALYLPADWKPAKRYPVIAEYPGNIFYSATQCWSTGRPEQCAMGYGFSSGTNAIWVSLPFVDRSRGEIAEAGFGSNAGEETTSYAMDVVEDICTNWGGDRNNLFLCGFSRGAIACGYIGLRNDKIARLWKGFVACQHYDGSRWYQSNIEGAVERAPRFDGKAIFQVDNKQEKYQPVVDATDPSVEWTWSRSGLGYHATAMFLDDRPSMKQLRQWFRDLVEAPR
ncbi:MAG: hypothetical protein H8E44_08200 [Planctomycetes bacterium]|nr:hypothetical protein [Planctomycetota bacterium]